MRVEFIHGPLDGQVMELPDDTTLFEMAMPDGKFGWKPIIHWYEKRDIMTLRAEHGFVYVGFRKPGRRTSSPGIG